jgi:hypothetical protein
MPRISKLETVLPEVEKHFDKLPTKVFTTPYLVGEFIEIKEQLDLPESQRYQNFVELLLNNSMLSVVTLESERYQKLERFAWGIPSEFALALTIKSRAYLTHGSAAFLHGLIKKKPKTIYVNYEQSPKSQRGVLSQDGIHNAFARPQRKTNLIYKYGKYSIVVSNGKNTGRLGICEFADTDGANPLEVTDIERTLIDITVRPAYVGGASTLLEIYQRAKDQVNIEKLLETLKTLDYIYPYHQAIGFFMDKAGYAKSQWSKMLKLGTKYEFYAAHELGENKEFDAKWKIYYPSDL